MCLAHQHLQFYRLYNWDGDVIINPVIPGKRSVVGTKKKYDLDVRELILSRDNGVILKKLRWIIDNLGQEDKNIFYNREKGSFDKKMAIVKEYVSHEIRYKPYDYAKDTWFFPDETISLGRGDCEDRAFLLASLAIAAGISNYSIRVIFGKIRNRTTDEKYDHVWVMYKMESGMWQIMDPNDYRYVTKSSGEKATKSARYDSASFDYIPLFAANDSHLWYVRNDIISEKEFPEYIFNRNFWSEFNPAWGGKLHRDITRDAITPSFDRILTKDQKRSLFLINWGKDTEDYIEKFASKVAFVDITLDYRPEVHFDNALIREGTDLIHKNFNSHNLNDLIEAIHTVEDFYAHSSYGQFAVNNGSLPIYADNVTLFGPSNFPALANFHYKDNIFDLKNFSKNPTYYNGNINDAYNFWDKKIISGRFGQKHDSKTVGEMTQFCPDGMLDKNHSGALPHHNEIAIDGPDKSNSHILYTDTTTYSNQFDLRKNAAIAHVQKIFENWK